MNNVIGIGKVSLKNKVLRGVWSIVCTLFFRPFGTKLFNPWRIFILKLFGADVTFKSGVYSSAKIWAPWNLKMGRNAWLGPNVICYNQARVCIDDDVTVSQYAYLCTASHKTDDVNSKDYGLLISPITIKKGAWVGTRAYIGMGVEIGSYAIVGATASVYKDVEDNHIVGGNPARTIKIRRINE